MTNPTLANKWEANDSEASELVEQFDKLLDRRLKELSDTDTTKRVLAAFLAYRGEPFQVLMGSLHVKDRPAVKAVLEALKGEVLLSVDNNLYQFRDEYSFPVVGGIMKTSNQIHTNVTTNYGTIYTDGTSGEVAFTNIALMGYVKPSCVKIVSPLHHWEIFFKGKPAPSQNWLSLPEVTSDTPTLHQEIMDSVIKYASLSGCRLVPYGTDSFLCESPNQAAFHINNTITRLSGKHGQKPLLEITDRYQRKDFSWGSVAS